MDELQIDRELVGRLQQLYHHLEVRLTGMEELGGIPVRQGLKQGCPCSPLLFSLLFDRVEEAVRTTLGASASPPPRRSFL